MEVSLLRALLHNISSFFTLSLRDNLKCEPVQKNYEKIEEILKLLKPVLDAIVNTEAAPDSQLGKEFEELGISIDESRDLFENWRPLASQVYLVLQAEQLTARIRTSIQEIFQVLKNSHQCLPAELSSSSLEHCIQKIKTVGRHQATTIIDEALKDQSVGPGPSPEKLVKISDCLGLKSNQEILIEAVALEKLKDNAEQAEKNAEAEYIDQLISLITRMHDRLVMLKQSESSTPVPIPPDFCCPLSLELMTDPVILASGQTYERAFIRQWLDLGLTVCPKTRQALSHTNLIPNFTVKQLIASWCEINNVKLPDPVKCTSENQPSFLSKHDSGPLRDPQLRSNRSTSPVPHPAASPSHPRLNPSGDELGLDVDRVSLEDGSSNSEEKGAHSNGQPSVLSNGIGSHEQLSGMHNRVSSDSNVINDPSLVQRISDDGNPVLHSPTDSDASGELTKEPRATPSVNSQREPEFPPRFISTRSRSQSIWRRPSERLIPRIVSSPAVEARPDLSGVEIRVKDLVNDLKSSSVETQREATHELRLLAKHNMDNRVIIANCGAIPLLVHLLHSSDPKAQENAVTALLNLSISDNNKIAIANAEAIEPLIHVLQAGSPEARENSAATLFSLSVIEENKVRIGRSGAIVPLVELLGNGTPRGKKDAATALFNLSIFHENKARIVQAGAVRHLVELMDPAAGMVDKAVAVLANLATIQEGRVAIAQAGGIPALVEVVELGSSRGKENAAAALLQLCSTSTRFCNMVLQEGAVPPLVALSQSGTPRAKEKAQTLLNLFRQQRHGNAGRG